MTTSTNNIESNIASLVSAARKVRPEGYVQPGDVLTDDSSESITEYRLPDKLFYRAAKLWRVPIFHVAQMSYTSINAHAEVIENGYWEEWRERMKGHDFIPPWKLRPGKERRAESRRWDAVSRQIHTDMENDGWEMEFGKEFYTTEDTLSSWCLSGSRGPYTTSDTLPNGCEVCQRCVEQLEFTIHRATQVIIPDHSNQVARTIGMIEAAAVKAAKLEATS